MSRALLALLISAVAVAALPSAASAGCFGLFGGCYTPPPQPCYTCYQPQYVPPQYRAVQETVMVSPGGVIGHRVPAQYQTVMVPQTVMVSPESMQYEHIPAQYAVRNRVEMVSPGYSYYAPVAPRCNSCGW
jgi:hypothetical protein